MEFKKLSDVEVVEAVSDAANVLIEENGVIKKAPKTKVGGAGGEKTDLVIRFDVPQSIDGYYTHVVSGSVEAVLDAYNHKRIPVVKVEVYLEEENGDKMYGIVDAVTCITSSQFSVFCLIPYFGEPRYYTFYCNPDEGFSIWGEESTTM